MSAAARYLSRFIRAASPPTTWPLPSSPSPRRASAPASARRRSPGPSPGLATRSRRKTACCASMPIAAGSSTTRLLPCAQNPLPTLDARACGLRAARLPRADAPGEGGARNGRRLRADRPAAARRLHARRSEGALLGARAAARAPGGPELGRQDDLRRARSRAARRATACARTSPTPSRAFTPTTATTCARRTTSRCSACTPRWKAASASIVSFYTAHNEMLARHPGLLARLYAPFLFDRQREHAPGDAMVLRHPLFEYDGERLDRAAIALPGAKRPRARGGAARRRGRGGAGGAGRRS